MRRNPDILRDIMLAAENQPAGHRLSITCIKTVSNDPHEIAEHVSLLIEAGFIDGVIHARGLTRPPLVTISHVKNAGHEFLQVMREDTIWKKVKKKVMIPAASWSLQLAVEYGKQLLRERLGLP